MSGRVHRLLRKSAEASAQTAAKQLAPSIGAINKNEQVTRARVDALEQRSEAFEAMFNRSLLERLKWLLLGR